VNSSSIMFAFFIAGFICVGIHDLVIAPIAYGPNNAMHQVAKTIDDKEQKVTSKPKDLALKK